MPHFPRGDAESRREVLAEALRARFLRLAAISRANRFASRRKLRRDLCATNEASAQIRDKKETPRDHIGMYFTAL